MKVTAMVWVLTFDPLPGVWETARVFQSEDEAFEAQALLPLGVNSLLERAPLSMEVDVTTRRRPAQVSS